MGDVSMQSAVDSSPLVRGPDPDLNWRAGQLPLCALLLREGVALETAFEGADPQEWNWYRIAGVDVDHRSLDVTPSDGPVDDLDLQIGVRRRRGSPPSWKSLLYESGVEVTV